MLRDEVAPRLRQLGFKGSGSGYSFPDDRHWILVGFQKGTWSTAEVVAFTMNVTVADKAAWQKKREDRTFLPPKPAPNVHYGNDLWQRRIGQLLPGGRDKWWEVAARSPDAPAVAELVGAAIHDYALPAIEQVTGRA